VTASLLARRDPDQWLVSALEHLDERGLVLDSDPKLPSVPSLVVERTVRGSWWADPEVHLIHRLGSRFTGHEDVLHVVLVSGKLTCLHKRLWPAFLAVALGNEQWKVDGLSTAGKAMLARLRREQRLTADEPDLPARASKPMVLRCASWSHDSCVPVETSTLRAVPMRSSSRPGQSGRRSGPYARPTSLQQRGGVSWTSVWTG